MPSEWPRGCGPISAPGLARSPVPCRLVTATDGAASLAAIRAHRPHLAILDARMPARSGLEVIERVRREPDLAGTRLLLLTGDAALEGAALGADGVLLKPCTHAPLLDAVVPLLRAENDAATA